MTPGFDKPLYILPFDHRGTFQKNMFGWTGGLTDEQAAKIAAMKQVIYDGFKEAIASGVPKAKAGILVDEQFGTDILHDAAKHGYITCCPAEKSGQDEFDFEYGDDFARHIETFQPTFCKVLVRYNPEGDRGDEPSPGRAAEATLRLPAVGRSSRFMFELLVPPTPAQLETVRRRQEGVRSRASARADGAGYHGTARRGHRAGRLEDRGDRPARGLCQGRRRRAAWGAGSRRLHRAGPRRGRRRRFASGSRPPRACRASSASPWAGRASGAR